MKHPIRVEKNTKIIKEKTKQKTAKCFEVSTFFHKPTHGALRKSGKKAEKNTHLKNLALGVG